MASLLIAHALILYRLILHHLRRMKFKAPHVRRWPDKRILAHVSQPTIWGGANSKLNSATVSKSSVAVLLNLFSWQTAFTTPQNNAEHIIYSAVFRLSRNMIRPLLSQIAQQCALYHMGTKRSTSPSAADIYLPYVQEIFIRSINVTLAFPYYCLTLRSTALEQGFSNHLSRPQVGLRNAILGSRTNWLDKSDIKLFVIFTRKLKVGLQWIYLCYIFSGNTVLPAVSCLLGCLSELWNNNNQPNTTSYALLRHDCFNVLTNIDLIAFIPTRRYAYV